MRYLLFTIILFIFYQTTFGQTTDSIEIDIKSIKYEPLTEDNYKSFPNAKLIVDYYYTNGISNGDRYSYEIILVDSLLMFGFSSPETEDYNYIFYNKKQLLTAKQVNSIKSVLVSAGLKQTKKGIPQPDASAHEKEVLIVKYKNVDIAGGLFNHVIFEDGMTEAKVNKEIAQERKLTSSIGGNYDMFIKALKKYFLDLPNLLGQIQKTD
jgi:hypothetical protein